VPGLQPVINASLISKTYGFDSQNLKGIIYLIIYFCSGDLVCQQTKRNPTQDNKKASAKKVSRS